MTILPKFVRATLLLLLLAATLPPGNAAEVEYRGTTYQIFSTRPEDIALHWRDPSGRRFGQLSTLQGFLTAGGRRVRFLMNAGIFEPDGTPSGLLVIDGQTLLPLNEKPGRGNFYLQPSGVFFVEGDRAFVRTTAEFSARRSPVRLAIQSGPMLLRGGRSHPTFRAESTSRLHRNGVGVQRNGTVILAITEFGQARYPNLWEFADFFRSRGCDDALFLDGDISQAAINPAAPLVPGNYFGALFSVSETAVP